MLFFDFFVGSEFLALVPLSLRLVFLVRLVSGLGWVQHKRVNNNGVYSKREGEKERESDRLTPTRGGG